MTNPTRYAFISVWDKTHIYFTKKPTFSVSSILVLFFACIFSMPSYSQAKTYPYASIEYDTAPWDGPAVTLYFRESMKNHYPFINISFFKDKDLKYFKGNKIVKNKKYIYHENSNNMVGYQVYVRYCPKESACERVNYAEVIFQYIGPKGATKGKYKIQSQKSILEGTFETKNFKNEKFMIR